MKFDTGPASDHSHLVAPFTGAWVEISVSSGSTTISWMSHPSRVRGLKSILAHIPTLLCVAPFTGAWVEMC